MNIEILGIGEYGVSAVHGDKLKTLGLGSCVAVTCHDPSTGIIGLCHMALPDSSVATHHGESLVPGRFVNLALPMLLKELDKTGVIHPEGLLIKLIGGASVIDASKTFDVGSRNIIAVHNVLSQFGLKIHNQDSGGCISRTVTITTGTGRVVVTSPGRGEWIV